MGEQNVKGPGEKSELQAFMRAILDDLGAMEHMLENGDFETGVRRIGVEQEMFLIDATGSAAPIAMEVLADLDPGTFTTELARFNLEANMRPARLGGKCLSRMHKELHRSVEIARESAKKHDGDVLLTGILPTIGMPDVRIENMTPLERYHSLNDTMLKLSGGSFRTHIKGADELQATHDNILLEACNTSFQVHFQVSPREFAGLYNVAQAVTAPVLAAAVNSPVLLQNRLWKETRIALFQQSIDARSTTQKGRGDRTRVHFGDHWVNDSVLELFREDLARFRVVLAAEPDEHPMTVLQRGGVPELTALRLHNGTVYRWNRPCYGIYNGKPHLRIENRVLPAGPTVADEVANAAFFFGLMSGLTDEYGDICKALEFDDAKSNFQNAARHGLMAQFTWVGGKRFNASELILEHLLPLARQGLAKKKIDSEDVDRYLGILEERVRSGQTGAQWALSSLQEMNGHGTKDERYRALVTSSLEHQRTGQPVHAWSLASLETRTDWRHSFRLVSQFMTKEVFTVRPHDIVDLAAAMMQWKHIRHVPVEDDEHKLVGLVTHREILQLVANKVWGKNKSPVPISQIMETNLITVDPETPTIDALKIMRDSHVGCLPVVGAEGELLGMVTEADLLHVAADLLQAELSG